MSDTVSQKVPLMFIHLNIRLTMHTCSFFSNASHSNTNPGKLFGTTAALNCRPILEQDWASVWALHWGDGEKLKQKIYFS